jgi:hypothetical protein
VIRNIVTLKGKPLLKVFGPYVLSKIFGPKREDVTGDWRKIAR